MNVIFLEKFYKDIDKYSFNQIVKEAIFKTIQNVELSSDFREIKNLKKLKGHTIAYRIKISDYRIGIYIDKNTVFFARIVHRKDIYKVFP